MFAGAMVRGRIEETKTGREGKNFSRRENKRGQRQTSRMLRRNIGKIVYNVT